MSLGNDIIKNYECSIEHFIQDEYSICREERQYAVFLYNILRKYHSKDKRIEKDVVHIFDACNIPPEAEIQSVFYEATFMRDFFERNRRRALSKNLESTLLNKTFSLSNCNIKDRDRSFNSKLITYVAEKNKVQSVSYEHEEVNLGQNKVSIKCDRLSDKKKRDMELEIRYMMNAKPDLAVIYTEKGEKKLLLIECKFESQESTYEGGHKQSTIQWEIADFLCKHYLKEEKVQLADKMKEDKKSCIVKFVRKKKEKPNQNENEILIKDLIRLNDEIFA